MTRALASVRRSGTAMRLAWRELRKDPRHGLLVVLLVALPATVLMTVGVVSASQQPTDSQVITSQLGSSEAWVQVVGPEGTRVTHSAQHPGMIALDSQPGGSHTASALASTTEAQERTIDDLLPAGTRTVELTTTTALVARDGVATRLDAVVGPVWDPAFAGMYDVVDGAAPADDEVLVSTELAQRWDLSVGDSVGVGPAKVERTVAGVIDLPLRLDQGEVFGTEESLRIADDDGALAFPPVTYLPDANIDWPRVQELSADGVAVYSRHVAENPPQAYLMESAARFPVSSGDDTGGAIIVAGLGLLEVVLLAGAAFAVSMRRRQERLAVLAANGAGPATLVGVGVWNGALLGAVGGVVGVPIGLAAGALWLWAIQAFGSQPVHVWGFHVTGWHIGSILAFTVAAGALSALAPAIASARRDVVTAMRGSRKPGVPRRWPSAVGAVLLVVGAGALSYAVYLRRLAWDTPLDQASAPDALAAQVTLAGVVLLLAGFLALTPAAIRLVARVLGQVSVGARIAARDAARHMSRSLPVVAAIAITVILAGSTGLDTFRNLQAFEATQQFEAPPGDAAIDLRTSRLQSDSERSGRPGTAALVTAAQAAVPGAQTVVVDAAGNAHTESESMTTTIVRAPDNSLCPVFSEVASADASASVTKREYRDDARCRNGNMTAQIHGLAVGGTQELAYILDREPTPDEIAALESGGAVTFEHFLIGPDASAGTKGAMRVETWDESDGPRVGVGDPLATVDVPTVVAELDYNFVPFRALLSPQAAQAVGADVVPGNLFVHRDAGFSELEKEDLSAAIAGIGEFTVRFADGQEFADVLILWGALIASVFVAAAATGLALGLARADARRDDRTLASLGAPPRLTRSVAAWQGTILVGFAVWIGMLCAVALDLIRAQEDSVASAPPWEAITVALLVPPLIMAGAAWVMTRPPKPTHYRLAA